MTGVACYEGLADWYDQQFPSAFSEAVGGTGGALLGHGHGDCLDVGCGTGRYLELIAGLGWRVTGIDESPDQLRVARAPADASGSRIVKGDATALPFADASFDAAVAIMISTDIEPYERVVAECARVLRGDGRFVHVGVHPCFAGPHSIFRDDEPRLLGPGYRKRGYTRSSPAFSPSGIRAKVGAVHVPLDDLLNGLIASGLRLVQVQEASGDPPVVLAFSAEKSEIRGGGARQCES